MISRPTFILAVLLLLVAGVWYAPLPVSAGSAIAPDASAVITPPLNTGQNTQQKAGSLLIGAGGATPAKLCLNASGLNDSVNCISSWSQFSSLLGSFVTLHTSTFTVEPGMLGGVYDIGSYLPRQAGYADQVAKHFTATPTLDQAFTTIVKASPIQFCAMQAPDYTEGRCINDGGSPCRSNAECTQPGAPAAATAVYATSSSNATGYAGYFSGRVLVSPSNDGQLGRICLGDPTTESACITSWNDLSVAPAYIQRFTDGVWRTNGQNGGAAISGVATFGSAVLGDSTGLTQYTCGDGVCQTGETGTSCGIDCNTIGQPQSATVGMSSLATPASLKVDVNFTLGAQTPSNVTYIIVRSSNTPPVFRPADGVSYSPGLVVGNDTLIRVTTNTAGAAIAYTDTLPASGVYYYQIYQANAYPRYSSPITALRVQPVQLTVVEQPDYTKIVLGSSDLKDIIDSKIACGADCTGMYSLGESVKIFVERKASGYGVSRWTGCTSSNSLYCIVTMDATKSITMQYGPTTDGGGGGPGRVKLDDGTALAVTAAHPFYDARPGTWREIGTMHGGDQVIRRNAGQTRSLTITGLKFSSGRGTVYNIEGDDYHNYYVNSILVHNKVFGGG